MVTIYSVFQEFWVQNRPFLDLEIIRNISLNHWYMKKVQKTMKKTKTQTRHPTRSQVNWIRLKTLPGKMPDSSTMKTIIVEDYYRRLVLKYSCVAICPNLNNMQSGAPWASTSFQLGSSWNPALSRTGSVLNLFQFHWYISSKKFRSFFSWQKGIFLRRFFFVEEGSLILASRQNCVLFWRVFKREI